jgi:hypothetical protein
MKGGKFLDELSDWEFLKKGSSPWSVYQKWYLVDF